VPSLSPAGRTEGLAEVLDILDWRQDVAGIQLNRVSKHYGNVVVMSDLSLDIAQGEFLVFLGPSGCG
jgi:ABC-type bacteriocin/lantibiotic exporter with double-glycine peptidase domain